MKKDEKILTIIPVLNEADSLQILVKRILKLYPAIHILIIDGGSHDGSEQDGKKLAETHQNLFFISQDDRGYGNALRHGFSFAINHRYDYIVTMDGDLSHNPDSIQEFLRHTKEHDLIIGSRFLDGIRINGWRFKKLLMSKLANVFISYILVLPIWDFTSGFRLYSSSFLKRIDLGKLENQAYLFQVQMIYLAFVLDMRILELPIIFHDSYLNTSKIANESRFKILFKMLKFRAPILQILKHLAYFFKDYQEFVEQNKEMVNPPQYKRENIKKIEKPFLVSVGIMAHNEESIIADCISRLQKQDLGDIFLLDIIVISSGSTDRTNQIVDQIAKKDLRVKLINQTQRLGKASAINEFLSRAGGNIVILESADTITEVDTIRNLLKPFSDKSVGMVGAHPIPVNNRKKIVGYFVHKLWELHHIMAKDNPKCGEMVAFHNIIKKIPEYTAVDEAVIEAIIKKAGMKLAYAGDAIVYNKGPENLKDFLKQRRRIASGHIHLYSTMGHNVSTQRGTSVLKYVLKSFTFTWQDLLLMPLLIIVEIWSRFSGWVDFYFKDRNPFIWDISKSTKKM